MFTQQSCVMVAPGITLMHASAVLRLPFGSPAGGYPALPVRCAPNKAARLVCRAILSHWPTASANASA